MRKAAFLVGMLLLSGLLTAHVVRAGNFILTSPQVKEGGRIASGRQTASLPVHRICAEDGETTAR